MIVSRITSPVTVADVRAWRASLEEELARVPDGGTFRLLVDMRGYEAGNNPEAHQEMRVTVPTLLARHGLRTAILNLFPEAKLDVTAERGVTAEAVAYVHHDANKMAMYNDQLNPTRERFFTDRAAAEAWLQG